MARRLAVGAAVIAAAIALVVLWRHRAGGQAAAPRAPARVQPVAGAGLEVALRAAPLHVVVGQPVALTAEVRRGTGRAGAVRWSWVATRGRLTDDGGGAATWVAPGKPGRFAVGVVVEDGGGRARAQVTMEVRLPSLEEAADLAGLMKDLAARDRDAVADLAELERRIAALRATAAQRDSIEDRLHAQAALEELADVYAQLGRYEDARAVWDELLAGRLPGDSKYRGYQARYGDVAFFLGDDEAALRAWDAGGDYVQGMSRYYQGEVLERAGDLDGARDAYARAQGGAKWFGDPVYRDALLALRGGASEADVATLLVEASSRLDRDRMLERFDGDAELRPLRDALDHTGRAGDLQAARPLTIDADAPGD